MFLKFFSYLDGRANLILSEFHEAFDRFVKVNFGHVSQRPPRENAFLNAGASITPRHPRYGFTMRLMPSGSRHLDAIETFRHDEDGVALRLDVAQMAEGERGF